MLSDGKGDFRMYVSREEATPFGKGRQLWSGCHGAVTVTGQLKDRHG